MLPELPRLPEGTTLDSPNSPVPPPPIEKDPVRQTSVKSARSRPAAPPKERRRSGGSTLQLVSSRPGYSTPSNGITRKRVPAKHQHIILRQLNTIKHWFKDNAKRNKSPSSKSAGSTTVKTSIAPTGQPMDAVSTAAPLQTRIAQPEGVVTPLRQLSSASRGRASGVDAKYQISLSPAFTTPRSSYRLSTGPTGLRGRKSTSSSVSSVRSIHHLPSHSKASSTSSTTNSIHSAIVLRRRSRSPHSVVKMLPTTPILGTFPSNVRVVRGHNFDEAGGFHSPTAHVFGKRKRTPFRGPHLTLGIGSPGSSAGRVRDSSTNASRSASVAGRASGEIIQEESEEEDIEEVETFSPVGPEAEEIFPETN